MVMDIVFDFDGVLCKYEGWRGHDNIGKPITVMIELVKKLHAKGHHLKLCTTRLNPYPFGQNKKADDSVQSGYALETITEWLYNNKVVSCFEEITGYKPFGDIYIDDRAIRFENPKQLHGDLEKYVKRMEGKG